MRNEAAAFNAAQASLFRAEYGLARIQKRSSFYFEGKQYDMLLAEYLDLYLASKFA